MQEIDSLRDQSKEELQALEREVHDEIFQLGVELSVNRKLEKPHLLKQAKKKRARILTLLRQKQEASA